MRGTRLVFPVIIILMFWTFPTEEGGQLCSWKYKTKTLCILRTLCSGKAEPTKLGLYICFSETKGLINALEHQKASDWSLSAALYTTPALNLTVTAAGDGDDGEWDPRLSAGDSRFQYPGKHVAKESV